MSSKGLYTKQSGILNTEDIINPYTPSNTDYVGVLKNPGIQINSSSEYIYSNSYVPSDVIGSNLDYPVPTYYTQVGVDGPVGYPVYLGDGLTVSFLQYVPAGTFTNGDIVEIEAYFESNVTTAKGFRYIIYHNTNTNIPSDPGTNILSMYGQGDATSKNVTLRRSIAVRNAATETIIPSQTTISFAIDVVATPTTSVSSSSVSSSTKSINWNIDQYILFAIDSPGTYDGTYAVLASYKIVKY